MLKKCSKVKHIPCRRCNSKSYSLKKRYCVSCNFKKGSQFKK